MEIIKDIFFSVGRFVLFIAVSLVFLPAFLIVTYLHDYWSKQLGELFGV